MANKANGSGTADDPWVLLTPPGTSEFTMHRDDSADPPELAKLKSASCKYLLEAGGVARVA